VQKSTKKPFGFIVSQDKLSVHLFIRKDHETENKIRVADIAQALKDMGIKYGIDHEAVENAVTLYNDFGIEEEGAVIAKGESPVNGEDGRIEWLVKKPQFSLKTKDDDTVDFKDVSMFTAVKKGQPILRMTPASSGRKGVDVFGTSVPARQGREINFPSINNTEISKGDPHLLASKINACVILKGNTVELSAVHEVMGDVDLSTGNIRFEGSVIVRGDVKSGFEIHSKGNVEIGGLVEDATIVADGDVNVKGGFLGEGKGVIRSGGQVHLKFIRNQKVEAIKAIYISNEALNSNLYSHEKIYVASKRLGLAGGFACAINGMQLGSLGSETEVKTEIYLGTNPEIRKLLDIISGQLEPLEKRSAQLANELKEIENAKKKSKYLFEKLIEKMEKVMEEKMNIDEKISKLLKRRINIEKENKICAEPQLRVNGEIYPGVTLLFNSFRREIVQKMSKRMFYLKNGEIKDSPLVGI